MVSLTAVQASNARIPTILPSGLVAVFVGATSGIGEYTLKEFAHLARQPRIYNIGRSQQASDRIAAECKKLNPDAQYTFIQADVSLIRNVDDVCEQIKAKEKTINVLFLSAGTLVRGTSKYFMKIYLFGSENCMTNKSTRNKRRTTFYRLSQNPFSCPLHPQPPPAHPICN